MDRLLSDEEMDRFVAALASGGEVISRSDMHVHVSIPLPDDDPMNWWTK